MAAATLTGGCLCGAVRFRGTPDARGIRVCHCGQCRRFFGGPMFSVHFVEGVMLERDAGLTWFRSSDIAERGFCSRCGSSLFWRRIGEARDWAVSAGALDSAEGLAITEHIWIDDKPDYYDLADDAPRRTAAEVRPGIQSEE